jgi:hypothetical protein
MDGWMDEWMDEAMMRLAIFLKILSRVSVDGMEDLFLRVLFFFKTFW